MPRCTLLCGLIKTTAADMGTLPLKGGGCAWTLRMRPRLLEEKIGSRAFCP